MLKKNLASLGALANTKIPSGLQHIAGGAVNQTQAGTITRGGETFSFNWDVKGTITRETIYNRDNNLTYQQWLSTPDGIDFVNRNT